MEESAWGTANASLANPPGILERTGSITASSTLTATGSISSNYRESSWGTVNATLTSIDANAVGIRGVIIAGNLVSANVRGVIVSGDLVPGTLRGIIQSGNLIGAESDPSFLPAWGGYPVWQDEFDGGVLSSTNWHNRGPSFINTDDDAYIYAENAFISDGKLVLRTDYRGTTPEPGRAWGTAYIDTIGKFSQRYGRFEVRMKSLKPLQSSGIWPAFWLRDNSAGGENDVYEAVGTPCANPGVYTPDGSKFSCTFYTNTSGGDVIGVSRTANTVYTLPTPYYDFHVYACEWTPDRMTNYCDGVKTLEILASTAPGDHILPNGFPTEVHIRLSQHVGTDWAGHPDPTFADTENPNDTLVDYVRVWEYQG